MSLAQARRDNVRPIFCSSLYVSRTGVICSSIYRCARVELTVSMFEAVVQIFHLGSDVIPGEMRGGVSSSGFAHRSGEAEVGGQQADGRTERLRSPVTTRPAPDFRTISAAPTSGVTTTGTPRRIASSTVLPKFSEYEGSTKSRAAANRRSFSDPITVRGRMRTRSAIRRSAGKLYKLGSEILVVGAHDG